MAKVILGISAYYHDSAAAVLRDGQIVAAAQEERFTRRKNDAQFPAHSIAFCLKQAQVSLSDVSAVVFYDKPFIKFERLLETYLACAPKGLGSFIKAMPVWLKDKLYLRTLLKKELAKLAGLPTQKVPELLFAEHHQSHAASAFFASPFLTAAVLCLDGVGEWATTSVWRGEGSRLTPEWEIDFPHSLGLLYSAFTYFTGFKVNSGEYKLMGLAPYGEDRYSKVILENLIDLKPDGTFRLNMAYFNYLTGLTMTNDKFAELFGGPARKPESPLTQREMDMAASIQKVTEEVLLRLGRTLHREMGQENLCLAGGVALNCVANGRLLREGPFKNIWIQPAAGDAGGALGAALSAWHQYFNQPREVQKDHLDQMQGGFLGPSYTEPEIASDLNRLGAVFSQVPDESLYPQVAKFLADGAVVGWFQGRMEFGPRSLGARSILGDARNREMQTTMNLKIKYRESFRPFAPAVLGERVADYFEIHHSSPYMLLVANVNTKLRTPMTAEQKKLFGIDKLRIPRSTIPAVTHVDYSARLQTVHAATNPQFHRLLSEFDKQTGCGVLVNTSFNVRGEPIVCSPEDAFRCFMRTEMDYLVLGNFVLRKSEQSPAAKNLAWQNEFQLD